MKKSRFFVLGMLALIFGLAFIGCSGGGGKEESKLNGTWGSDTANPFRESLFVLENGNFQFEDHAKGTYTVKDSTITFKFTHSKFGDGDWQSGSTKSVTAQITGDTTFDYTPSSGETFTYTKK